MTAQGAARPASGDKTAGAGSGVFASLLAFVGAEHRYVLLGTSAVALVGMWLSAMPRTLWSFMRLAYPVEVVLYGVLLAWVILSALALVNKLVRWDSYAASSPFVKPGVRRALRMGSYVVWGITGLLAVDRLVLGACAAWEYAAAATSNPSDTLLSIFYMLQRSGQIYATGIGTTIGLAVFGTVIAFFLALLLVFCRIQRVDRPDNDLVRFFKVVGSGFARLYSTVVRGTPMMVQAGIIYYGVHGLFQLSDLTTTQINGIWSPFVAGLVTISLNSTAYMMEVLRGGIESVDRGQAEAARSLGLSQWQAMAKVVFPQGIKYAIPGLSNELVVNIKDSSVLSIISVFDLMFADTTVAGIYYRQFENNLIAAVIYLVLTMVASWLLARFARRFDVKAQPLMSSSETVAPAGEEQ